MKIAAPGNEQIMLFGKVFIQTNLRLCVFGIVGLDAHEAPACHAGNNSIELIRGLIFEGEWMPEHGNAACLPDAIEHGQPYPVRAVLAAWEEMALAAALWSAAVCVALTQGRETPGSLLWSAALVVQSFPYLAAIAMSLLNGISSRTAGRALHARAVAIPIRI
mgnify:CR=1 FL=1